MEDKRVTTFTRIALDQLAKARLQNDGVDLTDGTLGDRLQQSFIAFHRRLSERLTAVGWVVDVEREEDAIRVFFVRPSSFAPIRQIAMDLANDPGAWVASPMAVRRLARPSEFDPALDILAAAAERCYFYTVEAEQLIATAGQAVATTGPNHEVARPALRLLSRLEDGEPVEAAREYAQLRDALDAISVPSHNGGASS